LDYYYELSGVGAEFDISLTVRECIHQINNAQSKLKDMECDKDVLVQKELKPRENRRTAK
jgi:hypothetical protein